MSTKEDYLGSYNYFESFFYNSRLNAMLVMTKDGTMLSVNSAFTSSFGYDLADVAGKNFSMLFTENDRATNRPAKEIATVISKGQADDKNYLVKKNGETVWVSGETIKVDNENNQEVLLKIIQDINLQKSAEMAINRAHDFNESILTSIDDIVVVLNSQLNIIKANNAFYSLFKKTSPEKALHDFVKFIGPYDHSGALLQTIQQLANNGQFFTGFEMEINTSFGDRIFSMSGRTMQTSKNEECLLLVAHEITIQKQLEKEREDIIGFVAHELRNPLSNVILCNEMLKHIIQDGELAQADELLQRSHNNVMRLNKMIAELYESARVDSGNFILEITEFDFDEMIKEAICTVGALQPSFRIVHTGTAGLAKGDRYRLIQVVTNYLSNGIKYSNGNAEVSIHCRRDQNVISVSVKDYGLGIPENQLPYIFNRFFRTEKTKNLEGIGLGLFLCRRIINAHGGKVWVESEDGKGSTFYFSILA